MNKPFRLILVSIAIVIPSVASGQTTTAFDGTYQGVSNTASAGGGPNCGSFAPVPRPLMVSNGVARFEGGLSWLRVRPSEINELVRRQRLDV